MLNEQIWQFPRPWNSLTTPTQVLFKFSFVQSSFFFSQDFSDWLRVMGALQGGYLSHLGGQEISRHTSSYLHANNCCPNYESFSSIHVSKSWKLSFCWIHGSWDGQSIWSPIWSFLISTIPTFAFGFVVGAGLGTLGHPMYWGMEGRKM